MALGFVIKGVATGVDEGGGGGKGAMAPVDRRVLNQKG